MNFASAPSHVAILVPSVRKAADFLRRFEFQIGEEEEWDGEGTREIYVERGRANALLLMEPAKPGAYSRALEKRGPGLHHLAIDVLHLEDYIESLAGSGWLLHPTSVKTMRKTQTAYLARPGFPGLIEVQQKAELQERVPFVEGISIPFETKFMSLVTHIGLEHIVRPSSDGVEFSMGGQRIKMGDLL